MELDPDDLRDPVGRTFEQIASLVVIFLIAVGIDLAVQVAAHAVEWATYQDREGLAR
jgi:predicted RND superfamily exporter protein